jgi:hypothetical protein
LRVERGKGGIGSTCINKPGFGGGARSRSYDSKNHGLLDNFVSWWGECAEVTSGGL